MNTDQLQQIEYQLCTILVLMDRALQSLNDKSAPLIALIGRMVQQLLQSCEVWDLRWEISSTARSEEQQKLELIRCAIRDVSSIWKQVSEFNLGALQLSEIFVSSRFEGKAFMLSKDTNLDRKQQIAPMLQNLKLLHTRLGITDEEKEMIASKYADYLLISSAGSN